MHKRSTTEDLGSPDDMAGNTTLSHWRTRSARGTAALSLLAALLGLPPIAHAGGIARYPGTMCRYYGQLYYDNFFDPTNYSANGLRNVSSSLQYVTCPLILNQNDAAQNYVGQAAFNTNDLSGSCKLYRRSITGSTWGWFANTKTIGGNAYYWGVLNTYFDCSNYNCSFYCGIPAGAVIEGYQVTQGVYQ